MAQIEDPGSEEAAPSKARRNKLEKITNIAILVTLLFLLLNPSGFVGRWFGRQVAEVRDRQAVANVWSELTDVPGGSGLGRARTGASIVVEFLDYQCPACRTVAPAVTAAWDEGTATMVIRHLPLERIHPFAMDAAKAVVCAEWQGRMREAHEALLSDEGWVARRDWLGMAESVGVGDLLKFEECLGGREAEARVESDRRMAAELDIASLHLSPSEECIRACADSLRRYGSPGSAA